jgi:hypothetical protein
LILNLGYVVWQKIVIDVETALDYLSSKSLFLIYNKIKKLFIIELEYFVFVFFSVLSYIVLKVKTLRYQKYYYY